MTPKLIRFVAAACLAAALLPAQEEEEIIVRVSGNDAKASSKASGISSKKLSALIEKLGDDELSSAERKKLKSALMKMLGDVSEESGSKVIRLGSPGGVEVAGKAKSKGLRWHVAQGKDKPAKVSKKAKSSDRAQIGEWLQLAQGGGKAQRAKESNRWAEIGSAHKAHGIELDVGAIASVQDEQAGGGKTIRWLGTNEQGQGKAKKAKGGKLRARAKQLRARLQDPESEEEVVEFLLERKDGGESDRLIKAKKAYAEAKKAYSAAKKAQAKAGGRLFGAVNLDDVKKAQAKNGSVYYVQEHSGKQGSEKAYAEAKKIYSTAKKAQGKASGGLFGTVNLDDLKKAQVKDGSVYYFQERSGKQDPKKGKGTWAKKGLMKIDGETIEWTTDAFGDSTQGKGKSKGGTFVFDDVPEGAWRVGTTDKGGAFVFGVEGEDSSDKDSFVFDTWGGAGKGDKGKHGKLFRLLKQGDAEDAHGLWVVGGEGGKERGSWLAEAPGADQEVLLKLLGRDGDDSKHGGFFRFLDGKEGKGKAKGKAKASHDVLLKLAEGAHSHADDVAVIVDTEACEECEEESGNGEVLEMIEEMRAEMRALREMMQEIRGSLRSKRTSSNSAIRARAGRLLPPAVRKEDAAQIRVRRRETR